MTSKRMPSTLGFLLAARRCELRDLEELARTCKLIIRLGDLVHALQKERGYANLFLHGAQTQTSVTLPVLQEHAIQAEVKVRRLLDELVLGEPQSSKGKTRLLHNIAHALHWLDEAMDLRWQVREGRITSREATMQFTRLIGSLLAVVDEAADATLDVDVNHALVALVHFMQGKEWCGQERAQGVAGFATGYFTEEQKTAMQTFADKQEHCFAVFAEQASADALRQWEQLRPVHVPVERMRSMLHQTSPEQAVDAGLGELWFDIATARIDAMHTVERMLADGLAKLCQQRMNNAREEVDDQHLLMSRFADQAGSNASTKIQDIRARVRSTLDERKALEQAKSLLVRHHQLSEQAAHSMLQQTAMKNGLPLANVARLILAELDEAPANRPEKRGISTARSSVATVPDHG